MSGRTRSPQDSDFGVRLRELRQAAALTQEELAHRSGLTVDAVSALERGIRRRPYPHTVRSLAAALGLSEADRAALQRAVPARAGAEKGAASFEARDPVTLPAPTTSLVGRETELAEISRLIAGGKTRLVTLTGTGGVGKTRLGLEVAHAATFADGVTFVGLAPLLDATQVLPAVSHAFGVRDAPGASPMQSLIAHLRPNRVLLLLDNAEHVLGAATFVADLLAGCPHLVILVTSRAPLKVRGESEYPVAPLPPPEASRLFVERARATAPDFTLDEAAAHDVEEICRRLAGLPLALELAAAKARILDPATLLARLDEAIAADGSRDLPARQRSMGATLDWSHQLLDLQERRALRWLSVFADGFTLDSAEAFLGRGSLAQLEPLIDNSLVMVRREPGGNIRYTMLEPIRQYARRQLREMGEENAALAAHTAVILEMAERAGPAFMTGEQAEWLQRIDREDDDIRAVMTWSLASGDGETAARMGWGLWLAWWLRGTWREGREWLELALERPLPPVVRNRAHSAAAALAYAEGALEDAGRHWDAAVAGAEESHDSESLSYAVAGTALRSMASGENSRAAEQLQRAMHNAEKHGQEWIWSLASVWLGTVRLVEGATEDAVSLFEQGLASARRRGDRLVTYSALYNLARVALADGDTGSARSWILESAELSLVTHDRANLAYCLDFLAEIETGERAYGRAASLFGAAHGLRHALGSWSYLYYMASEEERAISVETVRDSLGDDAFDQAFTDGQTMDAEQALRLGEGVE